MYAIHVTLRGHFFSGSIVILVKKVIPVVLNYFIVVK